MARRWSRLGDPHAPCVGSPWIPRGTFVRERTVTGRDLCREPGRGRATSRHFPYNRSNPAPPFRRRDRGRGVDSLELQRYIAGDHMDTDDPRISRWGEIGDDYLGPAFHMRFRPGQVLYGSRRTYLRKVAVAEFEGICANTTFVLESKDTKVLLQELLPLIMQTESFHEHSVKQSKGSVNPYVNFSDLAWYEFALPPLEKQVRCSRLLREIENTLAALDSLGESLETIRFSTLATWQERWEQQHGLRRVETLLREPPKNGLSPRCNSSQRGYQTVSISAIRDDLFVPEGCIKYAEVPEYRARAFFIEQDDVFVVRGNGNKQLAGQAGLARESLPGMFYPDLLIRLRFDSAKIDSQLATALWNSPTTHSRLMSRAKSTNGIWKINGKDIRAHSLAVPAQREQEAAKDFLKEITLKTKALAARIDGARSIKRVMMEVST